VKTPLALLLLATACGGPGAASPGGAEAAALNRAKCGGCHQPREPGVRTREELAPILAKHKDEGRAKLTDDQWATLAGYLAKK
jgi:hypothetical protein